MNLLCNFPVLRFCYFAINLLADRMNEGGGGLHYWAAHYQHSKGFRCRLVWVISANTLRLFDGFSSHNIHIFAPNSEKKRYVSWQHGFLDVGLLMSQRHQQSGTMGSNGLSSCSQSHTLSVTQRERRELISGLSKAFRFSPCSHRWEGVSCIAET